MKLRSYLAFFSIVGLLSPAAWAFPEQVTKHGPNCWNAALVHGGVLEAIRYMSGHELHEVLNSGVCTPVPESQLEGGELRVYTLPLAQLNETDRYIHANLRIDSENSLNKMTNLLTSKTQIEREEVVRSTYGRVAEIITLRDREGRSFQCRGKSCDTRIDYYRCGSLEARLQAEGGPLYPLFQEISRGLHRFAFLAVETDESEIASLKAHLATKASLFQDELTNHCPSTGFPCAYYREAARSFQEQLAFRQPSRDWLVNWARQNP